MNIVGTNNWDELREGDIVRLVKGTGTMSGPVVNEGGALCICGLTRDYLRNSQWRISSVERPRPRWSMSTDGEALVMESNGGPGGQPIRMTYEWTGEAQIETGEYQPSGVGVELLPVPADALRTLIEATQDDDSEGVQDAADQLARAARFTLRNIGWDGGLHD